MQRGAVFLKTELRNRKRIISECKPLLWLGNIRSVMLSLQLSSIKCFENTALNMSF